MKKIFLVFILCAWCDESFAQHEFRLWGTMGGEYLNAKKQKFTLELEQRNYTDPLGVYYDHLDLGFLPAVAEKTAIGFGYRFVVDYSKRFQGQTIENRPYLVFFYKRKILKLDFESRIRGEYRLYEDGNNDIRFRLRITFGGKFTLWGKEIFPYTSDELFFTSGNDYLGENRLYAGFKIKISDHIQVSPYYLLDSQFNPVIRKYYSFNVAGLKINYIFENGK